MKRLLLIAIISLFILGCGAAATESGFYEHKTVYAGWDHLWYSWSGYRQCEDKYIKESKTEQWWGIPEKYPAAACVSQGEGR